jgi:hypothetical protein
MKEETNTEQPENTNSEKENAITDEFNMMQLIYLCLLLAVLLIPFFRRRMKK